MIKTILLALVLLPAIAFSESKLPTPTGEVLLEISGNISVTNENNFALFDRKMVEALPQHTIKTSNHVVSEIATYKGPRLYDLLESLGAKGKTINVMAWDEYVAQLSISDLKKYKVLLATHENGKQMTLDDRGPFFVVFPFTDHKELRKDLFYNMSVWQVKAIEVN